MQPRKALLEAIKSVSPANRGRVLNLAMRKVALSRKKPKQ